MIVFNKVSTHSRLKAAGTVPAKPTFPTQVSTHSRLKAAGQDCDIDNYAEDLFQHTAA